MSFFRSSVMRDTALFLLFSLSILVISAGVKRALTDNMEDFHVFYAGATAFVQGENAYNLEAMRAAINLAPERVMKIQITTPSVLALLSPLAPLETRHAELVWLGLCLLAIAGTIALMLDLSGLRNSWRWSIAAISACLLLGPFRSVLWLGQTDIVALFATTAGIHCWVRGRKLLGVLLGALAMCLKVHSAGLFVALFAFRGLPRAAMLAILLWIAINAGAASWLQFNSPNWVQTWIETVMSEENAFNKVVPENHLLGLLTHLKSGLYAVTDNTTLSGTLALGLCLVMLFRLLLSAHDQGDAHEILLRELAIIALISLLIVYHRFIGAVLLVFPLFWALHQLRAGERTWYALMVLVCCASALLNGQAAYLVFVREGYLPFLDGSSALERIVLGYHFVWAELLMLLVLMRHHFTMSRFALHTSVRDLIARLRRGDVSLGR